MSILQNHKFLPSQATDHHPCCFCQVYICLLTKIKNCEGTIDITNLDTLYTSRKPPRHPLPTGVPSCEEPGSAHEQTCKISREELPHPIKQRRDELRKINFFVSLPLRCRLLISVDSCAEWGWPDTLGTIQGVE